MITFDIMPNEALKKTLQGKLSPFMIRTSQVGVFSIEDDEVLTDAISSGSSKKILTLVKEQLRKEYLPYKKDYNHYFKTHLENKEKLEIGLTLYLYDIKKEEYVTKQTKINYVFMDKNFFKSLVKPHKKTRFNVLLEIAIHDITIDMAHAYYSDRYSLISKKEWEHEYVA